MRLLKPRHLARLGLAGWAAIALAGLVAPSPASAAKPVCCFRVSIDVAGQAAEDFSKGPNWQPGPGAVDAGTYYYRWEGSAYALSEWEPVLKGTLQPIGSVDYGALDESSTVYATDNASECTSSPTFNYQETDPSERLEKGSKFTGLIDFNFGSTRHDSTFTFGPPADSYSLSLHCGTGNETPDDLVNVAGDNNWYSQFFASNLIRGLSSKKLTEGKSEHVLCTGSAMKSGIGDDKYQRSVDGRYAYYINIVHVPATEKKRNERRLKRLRDKHPKQDNPADHAGLGPTPPGNGCKA
jgi:hypothetical protein